jgi:hypothetical protein
MAGPMAPIPIAMAVANSRMLSTSICVILLELILDQIFRLLSNSQSATA